MDTTLREEQENEELLAKIYSKRERRNISISLNNGRRMAMCKDQRPVYFCGDECSGIVNLEIIGGNPVKQLKLIWTQLIQIRFPANNQSTSLATKRRKSIFSDLYFGSSEEKQIFYFDRQKLIQIDLLSPDQTLTDGTYELPFRFMFPRDGLPSTMKSPYGLIKYTIEAFTLDDGTLSESRGEKEIIFLSPNIDMRQINRKVERTLTLESGPEEMVEMVCILDRKSYVPGDTISLELTTRNLSKQTDIELDLNVVQRQIISNNADRQQIFEKNLTTKHGENNEQVDRISILIGPNQSLENELIQIRLPRNLVFSIDCPYITVKYLLAIIANNSSHPEQMNDNNNNQSASLDRSMEIPFLIGTSNRNDPNLVVSIPSPTRLYSSVNKKKILPKTP